MTPEEHIEVVRAAVRRGDAPADMPLALEYALLSSRLRELEAEAVSSGQTLEQE